MGFRFRKRIRICKGLYLNIGKKSMSTSVKVGNLTYNSRGRLTAYLGHGLSYSVNTSTKSKKAAKQLKDLNSQYNDNNTYKQVHRNIEQWENIKRKAPVLKGLCNTMIKVNKKHLEVQFGEKVK